jgi:hypothetical protein
MGNCSSFEKQKEREMEYERELTYEKIMECERVCRNERLYRYENVYDEEISFAKIKTIEKQALKNQTKEKQKTLEKEISLEKQRNFPYEYHGNYLCLNIKNIKDHIFKKYIEELYDYISITETNEFKSVVIQNFYSNDNNKYSDKYYDDYCYTNYNLSNKSYVYCVDLREFGNNLNVDYIFVIFDIIKTNSKLDIIIPVSIIGRRCCGNLFDFQINFTHEINDSFYSYNYYKVVFNNQWSLNLNLQICENCHEIYNKKHCNKCHLNYDNYHCCDCGQNYDVFNVNCKCVKNNIDCIICMDNYDGITNYYRTICNKSVICQNCLIVSNFTKCPCCRNSDIKNHIIK